MKKAVRVILVVFLILILVLIRLKSAFIFYDPFIEYFKGEFLTGTFPEYNTVSLFLSLLARYSANSIVSLGIIYLFLLKKQQLYLALKVYIVVFLLLSIAYYIQLKTEFSMGYLIAFYIRRILIHPIILLLLLPIFYYQKNKK